MRIRILRRPRTARPAAAAALEVEYLRWGALFAAAILLLVPLSARAGAAENAQAALDAAAWLELESVQNPDGSWGSDSAVRALYTAAAAEALRAYNRRGSAYFRGVAWLENRAMANLDYRARRISALAAHGDDVSEDQGALEASFSDVPAASSGWGLSGLYAPSPLDTAVALLALGEIALSPDLETKVQSALTSLQASQLGDGGWPVASETSGDPLVTALVVRALKQHVGLDGSVVANGDQAVAMLLANVDAASSALARSHAALAVLQWTPGSAAADALIDSLVSDQAANGSWGADAYVTAMGLRSLTAKLGTDDPSRHDVIPVGDLVIRSMINLTLGRNRGDALRRADVENITSLDLNGQGIESLAGLDAFTSLEYLDLRNNQITDVTPLLGLTGLETILLQNNPWAGLLCDVNDDGAVNAADGLLALRITAGDLDPTLLQQTKADITPTSGPGDGSVDGTDTVLVMRASAGVPIPVCSE